MPENSNGGRIASGTVGGLMGFFDYLTDKGIMSAAAVAPLRSAARQVFETVEGTADIEEIDVRSLEVEDYLDRFEVKARDTGRYQPDSITAYRRRFARGVEQYMAYITTGVVPRVRSRRAQSVTRGTPPTRTEKPHGVQATSASQTNAASDVTDAQPGMVSYPFPLASGGIATLRLPVRLERSDAERLAAFVRTLVFETQKEISSQVHQDRAERDSTGS
jgi:hypothetical protein